MKKGTYFFLILFCFSAALGSVQLHDAGDFLHYVAFDESMQIDRFKLILLNPKHAEFMNIEGQQLYDFFRSTYQKNNFLRAVAHKDIKIPKIIHQIWIGKELPEELKAFQESWRKHHPDWEYKLWTQHDIPLLSLQNRDLINAAWNPGEKSDLLRCEILYQYGGVYVDTDMECLQSLDALNYRYDFYAGLQPLDSFFVQVGTSLIASVPGHPILKRCLDLLGELRGKEGAKAIVDVPIRTGPFFLTRVIFETLGKTGTNDIVLPAHYFNPLGSREYDLNKQEWIEKGAFAIHHWAKTWIIPANRRMQFRSIKN